MRHRIFDISTHKSLYVENFCDIKDIKEGVKTHQQKDEFSVKILSSNAKEIHFIYLIEAVNPFYWIYSP
jgi:hypothetical protein